MTSSNTSFTKDNHDSLFQIANDLEVAAATVGSMIKLAERALAEEDPAVSALVQVAGRYAQDISQITERLIEIAKK